MRSLDVLFVVGWGQTLMANQIQPTRSSSVGSVGLVSETDRQTGRERVGEWREGDTQTDRETE